MRQKVFARESRRPMKAEFDIGKNRTIQLRDSLVLTQKSLAKWCSDSNLPVSKCAPIDYLKVRTPLTPITDEEMQYIINDVVSMVYGIEQYKEKYGFIEEIPLTQTGEVRRPVCANLFQFDKDWCEEQYAIMQSYSYDFFKKLTHLFQGGYTHANAKYVGCVVAYIDEKLKEDGYNRKTRRKVKRIYSKSLIKAFDISSSYPTSMTAFTFPIHQFIECDADEFWELEKQNVEDPDYRWFAKLRISRKNRPVSSKLYNTYWSLSKLEEKPDLEPVVDNGRIKQIDSMVAYFSDLDWDTFKQAYNFDTVEVLELYKSEAGYLSRELILQILKYYGEKTTLKRDDDDPLFEKSKYVAAKQFINSIYGMFCLKIAIDIISFEEENKDKDKKEGWNKKKLTDDNGEVILQEALSQMKVETTFGAYQLGIWVSSISRWRLWQWIIHFDERCLYNDTDSIKIIDFTDEDAKWVEEQNKHIQDLQAKTAKELGFDEALYAPKTVDGKEQRLGIFDSETDIVRFRTWGAKRYAMELVNGKFKTTIAGLPKKAGVTKLSSVDEFENDTFWNTKESMKNTVTYNDNQPYVTITDCNGVEYESTDLYGTPIVPTTFNMSISEDFEKFLQVINTGEVDEDDPYFTTIPEPFR